MKRKTVSVMDKVFLRGVPIAIGLVLALSILGFTAAPQPPLVPLSEQNLTIQHLTAFHPVRDDFGVDLECDENYELKSLFVHMLDKDLDIDYILLDLRVWADAAGTDWQVWTITVQGQPFDPKPGAASLEPYYFPLPHLANFVVPAESIISIQGLVEYTINPSDDILGVGVSVVTLQTATCTLWIQE